MEVIHGAGLALVGLAAGLAGKRNLDCNRTLDRNGASVPAGDFRPGSRVDLHHKDLGNMLTAARAARVSLPPGGLAAELTGPLRARAGGSLDHSALLLAVQALAGREDETWSPT